MDRRIALALALLLAAGAAHSILADTLQKTDGRVLKGKVISETADAVVFEMSAGGITMRQTVPRSQIRSLSKSVKEGPGYAFIPLWGDIGEEITAAGFKRALSEARREGAKIIVLSIDSPGGVILEMEAIIEQMRGAKDLEFVAFVRKNALSAAAIIAMACPTIVMTPDASLGAAVPFKPGADGTPKNIEEKAASFFRSRIRAAAELGKRSDLWGRGMSEIDLELAWVEDDAGGRLVEGAPEAGGKPVKKKGAILTLTAEEARSFGLSAATAGNVPSIRGVLGLAAWHEVGAAAADVMLAVRRERRARERELDQSIEKLIDFVDEVAPKAKEISARIAALEAQLREEDDKLGALRDKAQGEIDAAQAEYEKAMADAKAARSPGQAVKVREQSRAKIAAITRRHEQEKRDSRTAAAAIHAELQELVKQRNDLLAAAPRPAGK